MRVPAIKIKVADILSESIKSLEKIKPIPIVANNKYISMLPEFCLLYLKILIAYKTNNIGTKTTIVNAMLSVPFADIAAM